MSSSPSKQMVWLAARKLAVYFPHWLQHCSYLPNGTIFVLFLFQYLIDFLATNSFFSVAKFSHVYDSLKKVQIPIFVSTCWIWSFLHTNINTYILTVTHPISFWADRYTHPTHEDTTTVGAEQRNLQNLCL